MKRVFLFVLSLVLVGCKSAEISKPTSSSSPEYTSSPAPTGIENEAKARDTSSLLTNCLIVENNDTSAASLSGKLIIESESPHLVYLFDPSTNERAAFGIGSASNIRVSPDRNWIAYIYKETESSDEQLLVQSADGTQTYKHPVQPREWQSISHWLDNTKLVLWNHDTPLDRIVLFDPFTGKKDFMPNDYPGILPIDDDWDFYWPSITIFSPTLNELLYVAKESNSFKPGYNKLVLWNNVDQQAIAEVTDFGYSIVPPIWMSSREGALYVKSVTGYDPPVAHDEIYSLDLQGESRQLTHLADTFTYARIVNYSLSPDEHFLAIILSARFIEADKPDEKLLVINISSLEMQDLCISPERFSPLIWSPDKYQLAISGTLGNGDSGTIIVDIANKRLLESVENFMPQGWLR